MPTTPASALNRRAFAALVMVLSGAGLPVTGLAVHLQQMQPMAMGRHAWMAAHTGLAVTFVAFAVWHVALNRRALLNHLRGLARRAPALSREAAYAAAVVVVVLLLTVGHALHLG